MREVENLLVEMGHVSSILNGKSGRTVGERTKNGVIIIIAVMPRNSPGFNQKRNNGTLINLQYSFNPMIFLIPE